ncbi:MAG: acetylornithine transaminase [Actinomycetota bacterium]|nr:acetylornithine transaminase [Actinomycetota bacterium]
MNKEFQMNVEDFISKEQRYLVNTYSRLPVVFSRGRGSRLWDVEGKEYLDFLGGLGVANIGHCHPAVVKVVQEQMENLVHVSNLYYTIPQIELAEMLVEISFGDKCFFCNSGAEANEGALKLARKYGKENFGGSKYEVITAFRSFHGRTLKTLAATGQPDKQKPFEPLPPGFKHVPLNDLDALKDCLTENTCAVMLEPIQGEGGVYECEVDYIKGVRELCNRENLLLILDEVQTGMGRTGKMFAYEHYDIEPDVMTLAKGLGGGLPIGAFITREEVARVFKPGDHGSTFGGGPVATSAAMAALKVLKKEGLIDNCANLGSYFKQELEKLKEKRPIIKEVRGKGLMIGVEFHRDLPGRPAFQTGREGIAQDIVLKFFHRGVIANNIGDNIVRFLPPLCIVREEIETVLGIFDEILDELER